MLVNEVMTRHVECTHPTASLQEAAQKMRELDVGVLPVCGDNNELLGILTDRDITVRGAAEGFDPKRANVQEAMTPAVTYCFDDQDVTEAAKLMKEKQIRRLIVLNREKRLAGILSVGDLAVVTRDHELSGDALEQISEPAQPIR